MWHLLTRHADFFTSLGISSIAGRSIVQAECPETSNFHSVSTVQGVGNSPKNFRDSHFGICSQKLWEALGQNGDEFRSGHAVILTKDIND